MSYSIGTISDFATIEMGQSPKGDTVRRTPKGLPLLNGPTEFGQQHPTPTQWTESGIRFAHAGDILFCVRGSTTGRMNRADQDYAIGRGIAAIRAREGVDSRVVKYALEASLSDLLAGVSGSVFPNLSRDQILGHRVPVPPRGERQAIAEVLGALDDKIAANIALRAAARDLGLAMLQIEAPTTALGNVVLHHKRQINPASIDEEFVEHYSLPAFDGGGGPDMVAPNSIKSSKFAVETSAVLVSKLNPQTPRVWPINAEDGPPRLASTEFLVLEPFVTSPWVMWALISQPSFTAALQRLVAGTSGSHQRVRPEEVLATPILDPRTVQPQLLTVVGEILAPIDALLMENRLLAATRDALLPQLMSGKLRVRDAEAAASAAGA